MTARTHRIKSTTNSAAIITFVTRSMPFFSPALVVPTPMATTTSMYKVISTGFASRSLNTTAVPDASSPSNAPMALYTMNASIQPATTV